MYDFRRNEYNLCSVQQHDIYFFLELILRKGNLLNRFLALISREINTFSLITQVFCHKPSSICRLLFFSIHCCTLVGGDSLRVNCWKGASMG